MNLSRVAVLVAAAAAVALPASASAGTVSNSGGEIHYVDNAGERNFVDVALDGNEVVLVDVFPAEVRAGAGCRDEDTPGEPSVRCPAAGVSRITLDLGGGDDRAVLVTGSRRPSPAMVINGGPGTDELQASGNVSLDGIANDGPSGEDNVGPDVEDVVNAFAEVDDRFTGSGGANSFSSPGGTDVFAGAGGDDYLNTRDVRVDLEETGQVAPDQVSCGDGNDVADVDDRDVVAADCELVIRKNGVVTLSDQNDTFRARRPGLTIFGLAGNDTIFAAGARVVSGGDGNDRITLQSTNPVTANGNDGNDWIYGLVGRDRIIGGDGNDKLYGERSNDSIDGGSGRDGINAGRGDDTVRVRDGEVDRVKCSTGRDTVVADRRDRVQRDCERVSRR